MYETAVRPCRHDCFQKYLSILFDLYEHGRFSIWTTRLVWEQNLGFTEVILSFSFKVMDYLFKIIYSVSLRSCCFCGIFFRFLRFA